MHIAIADVGMTSQPNHMLLVDPQVLPPCRSLGRNALLLSRSGGARTWNLHWQIDTRADEVQMTDASREKGLLIVQTSEMTAERSRPQQLSRAGFMLVLLM